MPVSEHVIVAALRQVMIPGTGANVVEADAVEKVEVAGESVRVQIGFRSPSPAHGQAVKTEAERLLRQLDGVGRAVVNVRVQPAMAAAAAPRPEPPAGWSDRIPGVRHLVAVASGKGGVGKSTVAANLALALARLDRRVGLLDADIYGPSQQLMTGANGQPMSDAEGRILPLISPGGVKVMSFGFIVDTDQPVIWRGPMLTKALEQFVSDVEWGELDELVLDLPPGTGDIALTLCQNVTLTGAVIVTTPQDVALIDARKALLMFRKLEVPILGIVENMSHYTCPDCGHVEHLFGTGGGARTAEQLEVPLLGQIPIDPAVVSGGDSGHPVVMERPESPAGRAFTEIAERIAAVLER